MAIYPLCFGFFLEAPSESFFLTELLNLNNLTLLLNCLSELQFQCIKRATHDHSKLFAQTILSLLNFKTNILRYKFENLLSSYAGFNVINCTQILLLPASLSISSKSALHWSEEQSNSQLTSLPEKPEVKPHLHTAKKYRERSSA